MPARLPAVLGVRADGYVPTRRRHEGVASSCNSSWGDCVNRRVALALAFAFACAPLGAAQLPSRPPRPIPIVVVETSKGTFAFETYPNEAPKTVAHIVGLVQKGFYDGQRVHRALPGFIVQFGDPQTRDPSLRDRWGRGAAASSGTSIGVAEITKKRLNQAGAVGIAHMGNPAKGDSQIYITLATRRDLDGQYAVFGRVIEGGDVPASLQVGDEIRRVYIR
jgi:cyclophilin family peptidyl-prolyl cis-trans isomerase